jgi:magnesium chelatase subunit D
MLVLVTDGRANVSLASDPGKSPIQEAIEIAHQLRNAGIFSLIIDTEEGVVRTGLSRLLAEELNGTYVELSQLEGKLVERTVRSALKQLRNPH